MVKQVARCAIYEDRPERCRKYPEIGDYLPEECTYYFVGSEKRGSCDCGVGACCAIPRMGGEPGGAAIPSEAEGLPCKHLIFVDKEKEASADCPIAGDIDIGAQALKEVVGGH